MLLVLSILAFRVMPEIFLVFFLRKLCPTMSGSFCYSQPDRLNPNHSAPHSRAIPPRVAS